MSGALLSQCMLSICEVSYLYRGRYYYGWHGWRGGSRKILVKLSICLAYEEVITSGAGAAIIAGGVVARESYLRLVYT
jgi:hypothetical protein